MTETAADIKALILAEVGDTTPALVAPKLDAIWDSYADKADVAPRLQELYTKRRAIDLLLGDARTLTDENDGSIGTRQSQLFMNLMAMRKATEAEITTIEGRSQPTSGPVIGLITAPIEVLLR